MRSVDHTDEILIQMTTTFGLERIVALHPQGETLRFEAAYAVLNAASRFAWDQLAPINSSADREGCTLTNGRVFTPAAFRSVVDAFNEQGWSGIGASESWGGTGMPLIMQTACDELFFGACPSLMMLPSLQRSASALLEAHGSVEVKEEWLPELALGTWSATICISEPDAGSDVGRIQTIAVKDNDEKWLVSGEKTWISFGDHDLSSRIGHCVLARSVRGSIGTAGLSLFLVPNNFSDRAGNCHINNVEVRRLESKMGLHGSPTCSLGFAQSRAQLLGKEGCGLAQIFTMIGRLRLLAGVQGLGIAASALTVAGIYAEERRQGGSAPESPVRINQHADVQRMLLDMASRVAMTRGLVLTLSTTIDLAEIETDEEARAAYSELSAWLAPLAKTLGAEAGFDVAHQAIQILGGAGYTTEYSVEQALRDARVGTIYEGTSGIQALDLLHRQFWKSEGRGLMRFLSIADSESLKLLAVDPIATESLNRVLQQLRDCAAQFHLWSRQRREAEAGAVAFLQLAGLAALSWIAARLVRLDGSTAAHAQLRALGRYWLVSAPFRARAFREEASLGAGRLTVFSEVATAFN